MAKLSKEEANVLKRLQAKAEAPDAPPVSKSLNISVDLGDEKQVERATKLGLLELLTGGGDDDERDDDDEGDGDDDEDEHAPKRRGYFGE